MSLFRLASPGWKLVGLSLLGLVLLIPLGLIGSLLYERMQRADEASAAIAAQWGAAQHLLPAAIVQELPPARSDVPLPNRHAVLLPDRQQVAVQLAVERRKRGLFTVPVYVASIVVDAHFTAADLAAFASPAALSAPQFVLGVADLRGLRAVESMTINGAPVRPESAGTALEPLALLGVPLPDAGTGGALHVRYQLRLAGLDAIQVLPLARENTSTIRGDWADPSFIGSQLPDQRDVTETGFSAEWRTPEYSRPLPQRFIAEPHTLQPALAQGLGVNFYLPAGIYQQNERSTKYGVLVIALSFMALFGFEMRGRLRLHPIQYALVGASLATFYLMLLALSEHIGFTLAYIVAAAFAVGLNAAYMAPALGGWVRALPLAGMQASVYAVFLLLVRSEDHALLLGTLVLATVLAVVMLATRRTDWYALGKPAAP
jgi:inner membrane protein